MYHDGMSVPRQEAPSETGRINQKRRTRAAIVDAAKNLLVQGVTPTVPQAAEAALVSRTTAYRYFPTQEALLIEVAVNVDVDEIEQLANCPVDRGDALARTIAVLDALNRHAFSAETEYRTALRLYLDLWLAATADGDDAPIVREGRRRRWIEQTLSARRADVDDHDWDRLVAALCLLTGGEAVVVLRDVCHLGPEEGQAVSRWAADTLLRATFERGGTHTRGRTSL